MLTNCFFVILAIISFTLILPHLKDYFSSKENKEYRSVFIHGILKKISHENYLIRKNSFTCLIEIVKFFYDFLDEYIEELFRIEKQVRVEKENENEWENILNEKMDI